MELWFLVGGVVLLAAALQTSTGFGFSQLSMPLLITVFTPRDTLQITLLLSLLLSLSMLRTTRLELDRVLLRRWVWSGIAGVPVGTLVFLVLPVLWFKVVLVAALGVALLFLTLQLHLRRTRRNDLAAGFLSGMLTTSVGLPGPPLLVYSAGTDVPKAVVRSTTLTFYLLVYVFGILSQLLTQGMTPFALVATAVLLAPLFLGVGLGRLVFPRVSQRSFKWLLSGILFCAELYLCSSLWGTLPLR